MISFKDTPLLDRTEGIQVICVFPAFLGILALILHLSKCSVSHYVQYCICNFCSDV